MSLVLATVVGALFAVGTYLLLRRNLVHVVWGVTVLSQGANVFLLAVAGVEPAGADAVPVLAGHGDHAGDAAGGAAGEAANGGLATADPLVQALVLTAIVISFGMTAFALTLTYRVYEEHGTIDATELGGEP